VDNFKFKL